MKKTLLIATSVFALNAATGQTVIDFESFPLSGAQSYDNGSAGNGAFNFGGVTFDNNFYNWGGGYTSFDGFAISNVTNNTTAGPGNQYASYTGGGANASSQYSVFYSTGGIQTNNPLVRIDSMKVTNTTYAALSMKHGDIFAKQFGSVNGADGQPDGTNGEDYFILWIYAESADGAQEDSTAFYLADYRFADNAQDYILDEWVTIDFTGWGFDVANLHFAFESSDTSHHQGTVYNNTPVYFAIDDVAISSTAGHKEISSVTLGTYPNPMTDFLTVKGLSGILSVTDASGKVVMTAEHHQTSEINVASWKSGVYFVKLQTQNGMLLRKVVK